AILDTGSPVTCMDFQAFASLGLLPSGHTSVLTPGTGAALVPCDEYDVSLTILHPSGNRALDRTLGTVTVADLPLAATGIPALIGWDLLHRWVFHCDGPAGIFSLDY
ncbi:MAG TPA: hypothetical protein VKI65_07005, partial [Gemmataceae bacterium]|nr:hypothetical protein [Gemmataceae bacterium]